jgi:hypothetical protein
MPMMFGFAQQRRQLLEAEMQRIESDLSLFGARRVYLTGDLAAGRVTRETGLDLVIVQETDEPFHRRSDFWVTHLRPRVATRFIVYTPDEFEGLEADDSVLRLAIAQGTLVIG